MKKFIPMGLITTALIILQSCSPSTKVVSSWKAPDVQIQPGQFKKVVVSVLLDSEANRRKAEEKISTLENSFIPSYQVLGPKEIALDTAQTKGILQRQGFDGAIVMRLMDKEKSTTYVPGSQYPSMGYGYGYGYGYYGYHSAYYGAYYDPGYVREDITYVVETSLYDLTKNQLMWTGLTTSVNPSNLDNTIDEIMTAIYNQMIEDGLITPDEETETNSK